MTLFTTESLPSLLVFGPQTGLPSERDLEILRYDLVSTPRLSVLREAIDSLPQFWQQLVGFDPSLHQVPGSEYLCHLREWLKRGDRLPHQQNHAPNLYLLAVTVLLHIVQYVRYLHQLGECSQRKVRHSVRAGGVTGHCVGFLSAIAVGCSAGEADLGRAAAIALRLAVCIGAYVDQDGLYSSESTEYAAIAVRWKENNAERKAAVTRIVQSFPGAYISSINDETNMTVTLKATEQGLFAETVRASDFHTKLLRVCGRFHSPIHLNVVQRLTRPVLRSLGLEFPETSGLQVPICGAGDGRVFSGASLTQMGLENILTQGVDWYGTLNRCVQDLPDGNHTIINVGLGSCIPAPIMENANLQVVTLNNIDSLRSHLIAKPIDDNFDYHAERDNVVCDIQEFSDALQYPPHSIAIVGMAGRFPGASSVDELWDLISAGKVMVEPAPVERLNLPRTGDYADQKWWGNFLTDPHAFDHKFFKKSSREATAWDPQQRILLEVTYQALESAGYFGALAGAEPWDYGCYIGAVMNSYYDNLSCHPATAYATMGTARGFLSGTLSHYFGWTGPALTIDTACSSSLVAVDLACRAIWSGQCSRAIAGGTNVISSPFDYQNLSAAGFLSPSGQCKPFDADADGYCRGEAVAVVVLKPLTDAVAENDHILGVVIGSATNQNHNCSQITAPDSGSQVELYQKVMNLSGVKPESVSYVEAHGTGTGAGDPVEVCSIRSAFGGPERDSTLYFSSIKGNIGHTEATAGVAGLIKILLMMKHREIAPQASYRSLNPKIPPLDRDKIAIPQRLISWCGRHLLALINSYGAAGSNSALMLRQKPWTETLKPSLQLPRYPICISAGSASGVSRYCKKLLYLLEDARLECRSDLLASLAFNLSDRSNHSLTYAFNTTVSSIEELRTKLESVAMGSGVIETTQVCKPVVLVFGGQESDFVGLSEDVYRSSTVFRKHLDSVDELLVSFGLESFYPIVFESTPLQDLVMLHSALFAVQYASAKSWIDCGLKVGAVVGHSLGQFTALCISGTLTLSDTLKLVSGRASLMQKHWGAEPGSMLFLQTSRQTVERILRSLNFDSRNLYAEIACHNGPDSHVVVGSSQAIEILQEHISQTPHLSSSVRTKRLNVTNGFHSRFTEPMLPYLTALASQLEWKRPQIHLETTDELESTIEPDYRLVSNHTRQPVFFQRAIERLVSKFSQCTWIEAGRGTSVTQLVQLSLIDAQRHLFLSPQLASPVNGLASLVDITVKLWQSGYATQFWAYHRSQKQEYEHLSLPPIQFEKTSHFLPFETRVAKGDKFQADGAQDSKNAHPLLALLGYSMGSTDEAVFSIDPRADRFQQLLDGHIMAGKNLAPVSLYFEVVARAALLLENDSCVTKWTPTVEELDMRSPIGPNTTQKISLILKNIGSTNPSWSFTITVQDLEGFGVLPREVAAGKVHLKLREDVQAARDFERFTTLTGYRRYQGAMDHPEAEIMQGRHIYRAFNSVVRYGERFHGIKQIASVGQEAAANVKITPDSGDPADQRFCDTPMIDSFMQCAGFLVSYFNNLSGEDVFVCNGIELVSISGDFQPDAGEWFVYANMNESAKTCTCSDVYVFDARTKKMVVAVFGLRFAKISQVTLARTLNNISRPAPRVEGSLKMEKPSVVADTDAVEQLNVPNTGKEVIGKRQDILKLLSDVTDLPVEELTDDSCLENLGIDSLMATELLNDIRSTFGVTVDLSTFLFFPNIQAIIDHINKQMGYPTRAEAVEGEEGIYNNDNDSVVTEALSSLSGTGIKNTGGSTPNTERELTTTEPTMKVEDLNISTERPVIISTSGSFEEVRLSYDQLAKTTNAMGFWHEAYPHQAGLVLAYVVEAFAQLGCDMRTLHSGKIVPPVGALSKHKQLIHQLHHVLEDGGLIRSAQDRQGFIRTNTVVEAESAETIYGQIIDLYPQHASVNKLVQVVGSHLATFLRGEEDAVQAIFGNRDTKKLLREMYEFWPLVRTPIIILGNFLTQVFTTQSVGTGKFRILEIGAGTGATTRCIVDMLTSQGINFEYIFTDISASLVNAATKQFKDVPQMSFDVLDIETQPKPEYIRAFHCVIASNCIHATRDVAVSLQHVRQMLRGDGFLSLIEITQNMYWLDIVFGLLEGWWLFEDGREHALIDEKHWERKMMAAGFDRVSWSDGNTPESKTLRVIVGFPARTNAAPEKVTKVAFGTLVYKRVGELEIHADVYYPTGAEVLPDKKMPIALMIHGGGHVLFGRKDVRPAQTRLLLKKGLLPVSLDYRLCPEVPLLRGAMTDVCDALGWARNQLPDILLRQRGLHIDGEKVVVVGWSSGGQLAMSLAWTAPERGLAPPASILSFYAPSDYEDPWWQTPIQPTGAVYRGQQYDVLEGVQDSPITNYTTVGAWEDPISDPRSIHDPRCRIMLHMNWKAQTLPILMHGLPSKAKAAITTHEGTSSSTDWHALPQPSLSTIRAASPRAQVRQGNYAVPTFFVHGTADELIPWRQSRNTHRALLDAGVDSDIVLLEDAAHVCDRSTEPASEAWRAVVRAYDFVCAYVV